MIVYCSIKRSPPMTEEEAHRLRSQSSLFGYEPNAIKINEDWYLQVRGDGADDTTVEHQLQLMRKHHAT